jgi:hypothetical protein
MSWIYFVARPRDFSLLHGFETGSRHLSTSYSIGTGRLCPRRKSSQGMKLTTHLSSSEWPSGQSSWLQIQRSWFYSRYYQIFWQVVILEWGPLSLVSTTEERLERKSSGFGLESGEFGHRESWRWPRGTLYPQNLALTSPTSGGRLVGIVRSRTQATEFSFCFCFLFF